MFGFRPGKSCQDALKGLNEIIQKASASYILDADIEGFFNHIDHELMIKCLEVRVKDPNIIRLIRKLLKASNNRKWRIAMDNGNLRKFNDRLNPFFKWEFNEPNSIGTAICL